MPPCVRNDKCVPVPQLFSVRPTRYLSTMLAQESLNTHLLYYNTIGEADHSVMLATRKSRRRRNHCKPCLCTSSGALVSSDFARK